MIVHLGSHKKSHKMLFLLFLLIYSFPFHSLEGQEEKKYTNSRYSFQLSLPSKDWFFRPPFTEEALGRMENPKTGAIAFVYVHSKPQMIHSLEYFQKEYIHLLDQTLGREIQKFQKIEGQALSHPNYLEYWITYRFHWKNKPYSGKYHFYIYGEPGFGQRMLALVWGVPEKNKDLPQVKKDIENIEKGFVIRLPSRPFPYVKATRFYLSLVLLIGSLLILGGIFFRVYRRSKKEFLNKV